MALDNLISVTFTEAELKEIDDAMATLERVLAGKVVNLTPEQRVQYSRVKYDMEVWVNKTSSYIFNNAPLVPTFIDVNELRFDLATHTILNPRIDKMAALLKGMEDINLLLGTDIFNACLTFYRSVKAAAMANAPGASSIYNDLKQQFSGGAPKKTATK